MRVLLTESDPSLRAALRQALQALHYQVVEALDRQEAQRLLGKGLVDAALLVVRFNGEQSMSLERSTPGPLLQVGGQVTLEQLEAEHIRRVVESTSSLEEAADILGINQSTLYRKRKRLGL